MHSQHQKGRQRADASKRRQVASSFGPGRLHAMNSNASVDVFVLLCRWSKRLVRFLAATVHYDAGARVDDFTLLNEDRVKLGLAVRIELEAGQPSRAFEMIDQAHS